MEKYKLINSVTKIETLCEKVTIDGFDYYVSDEEILDTDSYLNLEIKPNGQKNPFWGKIYKKYSITKDEKYEKYILQFCKKVIATNNLNIDVPKVVDEVEELSEKFIGCKYEDIEDSIDQIGYDSFKRGYNKSQETHPFSEEDFESLIEFIESFSFRRFENGKWRRLTNNPEDFPKDFKSLTTKEFIQLWKEQKPKVLFY